MSITAAIAIADALGIDDWLKKKLGKSNNDAAKVASKFIDLAVTKSGVKNPDDILYKIEENPLLATQLKTLMLDNAQALAMAPYQDRKDARDMHKINNQQADDIAERVMKYNIIFIAVFVLINIAVMHFMQNHTALVAVISNVLGMVIKSLFDERICVTGFYFGSSIGSKNKEQKLGVFQQDD